MLSRQEIERILELQRKGKNIAAIARKTDHRRKTVRKYLKHPTQEMVKHTWRTRENPFADVWDKIVDLLETNPGLEAKTIFNYLCETYCDKFTPGQLRTLQRQIKKYRVLHGESKEVMFEQEHLPGELCSSDFTHMDKLGITIQGERYSHMLYHFTLTYSNWEWVRICSSENFESLKNGLVGALQELGGVPVEHLTDSLSAAVHNLKNPGEFKDRYQELLTIFNLKPRATQPRSPNENGDIEQRHYRLKKAIEQQLMLRGSKEFTTQEEYEKFLKEITAKLNQSRAKKHKEELEKLSSLPKAMLTTYTVLSCSVTQNSTVRIADCIYSVPSRLIGEKVEIHLYDNRLQVWYGGVQILESPRLKGKGKKAINYRHIIGSLRRKPGAFKQYRHRDSLYPTTTFRIAYDFLQKTDPLRGHKHYIDLLHLAATDGQDSIEQALKCCLKKNDLTLEKVKDILDQKRAFEIKTINIDLPDLSAYDVLIHQEAVC